MIEITLKFHSWENPELIEFGFYHPLTKEKRRVVRGKSEGAYAASGSFQWTAGVQALSLFFVRGAMKALGGSVTEPLLEGNGGSAAAAFDYAICRSPLWLLDMFGVDSEGGSIVRRIIHITNSCRKHSGPVALSLNGMAKEISINVLVQNKAVNDLSKIDLLEKRLAVLWADESQYQNKETSLEKRDHTPHLNSDNKNPENQKGGALTRGTFLSILKDEVWRALNVTEIFNRHALIKDIKYLKALAVQYAFGKKVRNIVSTVDEEIIGNNSSESHEDEIETINVVREFLPLKFLVTPSDLGLISLLSYLQHYKKLQIDYEICSWHYHDLPMATQNLDKSQKPTCIVASTRSFSNALEAGYTPYMLSPQVSHFVVAPKHVKSNFYSGALAFVQKPAGTGSLFFDYLQKKMCLERNKVRTLNLAPDEITFLFSNETLDLKAVMGFPYHNLNTHLNQCTYLTKDDRLIHSNVIYLLIRSEFDKEKQFVRALDLLLRRAWFSLRKNFVVLSKIIESVADDKHYMRAVYRFGGLSHLKDKGSFGMFDDVSMAA